MSKGTGAAKHPSTIAGKKRTPEPVIGGLGAAALQQKVEEAVTFKAAPSKAKQAEIAYIVGGATLTQIGYNQHSVSHQGNAIGIVSKPAGAKAWVAERAGALISGGHKTRKAAVVALVTHYVG